MAPKTTLLLLLLPILLRLRLSSAQTTAVVQGMYWFPGGDMPVSAINATLFTHLFCACADLDPSTSDVTISGAASGFFSGVFPDFNLTTLMSIGGGAANSAAFAANSAAFAANSAAFAANSAAFAANSAAFAANSAAFAANSAAFAAMASRAGSRSAFINSSISLARAYGFHGMDLVWEYPSSAAEMRNYGALVTEWRAAVEREASSSGKARLLLTAAVFYRSNYYYSFYPVRAMNNGLDWVNVMAYDFYGPAWTPQIAGPSAALYNPGKLLSGDFGINSWILSGMSSKKIVMGFPCYGYAWRLKNANIHGLFAPAIGSAGEAMTYGQIKSFIAQNNAQSVYDSTVVANYCYSGTTWISFDDTQSIATKVSYAKTTKNLLGYFAWHAEADSNWTLSRQAYNSWGA